MRSPTKLLLTLFLIITSSAVFAQPGKGPYTHRQLDSLHLLAQLFSPRTYTPAPLTAARGGMRRGKALRQAAPVAGPGRFAAVCSDTSSRVFLQTDSITFYSNDPYLTRDGHILLSGQYSKWNGTLTNKGFMQKTDQKGNTVWLHTYDSLRSLQRYNYINYTKVLELRDGSLFLVGRTNRTSGSNDDIIFTKTDAQGNIIWTKLYKSRLWPRAGNGSSDYWVPHEVKEDPQTGDIYISNTFWDHDRGLTKLSASNGAILWSRCYEMASYTVFDGPLGLDILPNELRYFGRCLSYTQSIVSIYRLNKVTGDTLQTLYFQVADSLAGKLDFLGNEPMAKLQNGGYALGGKCYGQYQYMYNGQTPLCQAAVLELDSNLAFVKAYAFRNYIESNGYNSRVSVFPDGSALFTMLKFYSGYTADLYYTQTANGQIIKNRKKQYNGEGFPQQPAALRLPGGGDLVVRMMGDSAADKSKTEFLTMHPSDTASFCVGYDDNATTLYYFRYRPYHWGLDSIAVNVIEESGTKTLGLADETPNKLQGCYTVSYCDSLSVTPVAPVICLSQSLDVTVRKNAACGALVRFTYDTSAVQSAAYINDTTVRFRFRRAWTGNIIAHLEGCTPITDTVAVRVLQAQASLNLGPDRELCPGNSILLNAHAGYASYTWQNGSTDSTFVVTGPGLYYVVTTDACGGVSRDSVTISAAPPIPFSAGPDRTKCNADSIQLTATPGFISYNWSNNYLISSLTTQSVVVRPVRDTAYYVRAEKTPGCFAYDTVRITVLHSPPIALGADRRFCAGDSALLDAGPGFARYSWSNGGVTPVIIVRTPGEYRVQGTTLQGCNSFDTVLVLPPYPLPVPALDKNSGLCSGTVRVLSPGVFDSYAWNTGATSPGITVGAVGRYAVVVTDANGCRAEDSTTIAVIHPLPAHFLPPDTALCSYGSLDLRPAGAFNRYSWSNGSAEPALKISAPGRYWLRVIDANNCSGSDTVLVTPKECLKGLYVPTAFTPNRDGKNDRLKGMLFGTAKAYLFRIYNRWGEVVFQTTDPATGWDGTVGGMPLESTVFIWTCTYWLEGEAPASEKGTFVLVR
ncbi:gliding motility-associated C-terminal domain-containing protein [Flaviaesturariibacter flavus]|uniref:Gliding motility-associated C-terminal domain-containing protein n=1 Tax=Flaviaesturariibacter flavus TaxID=2502780 RepID=A0A4R1BK76_9BACT|nr:T9SS type B sorting domain-containing protein [Flaviaesturariibacter flavus]TCJ17706.1 gliding motility-associated C-terminal domain-containing protein [Flaviaesturariibacter flavus]